MKRHVSLSKKKKSPGVWGFVRTSYTVCEEQTATSFPHNTSDLTTITSENTQKFD